MSENFESTYESLLPNQDFWESDGISLTGNPNASPDIITFGSESSITGSRLPGGMGEDHLSLNSSYTFNFNMSENTNANGFWKYNEDKILKQLEQYISGTYSQHYVDRTGGGTEQHWIKLSTIVVKVSVLVM